MRFKLSSDYLSKKISEFMKIDDLPDELELEGEPIEWNDLKAKGYKEVYCPDCKAVGIKIVEDYKNNK